MRKIAKYVVLNIIILIIGIFINSQHVYADVIDDSEIEDTYKLEISSKTTIYKQPKKKGSNDAGKSLDDMFNDADSFINQGNVKYNSSSLSDTSNTIYTILLTVGVAVAVIVGAIMGIKLMASGVEEKAEIKKLLVPYLVGCIVIFGGFGIWKLIVTMIQGV